MKKIAVLAVLAAVLTFGGCGSTDSSVNDLSGIDDVPQTTTVSQSITESGTTTSKSKTVTKKTTDSSDTNTSNDSKTPENTASSEQQAQGGGANTAKQSAVTTVPAPAETAAPAVTEPPKKNYSAMSVDEILNTMTLEEKVGQLFVVRPEKLGGSMTNCDGGTVGGLEKYHVGGVCMFGQNIQSPSQITGFINGLQSASDIPLFIAVDEEGGRVARVANSAGFAVQKFASMLSVGNTGDTSQAYNVGAVIGSYLKAYGFNVDLAPVADVNTNPNNVVIGDRAFGSDPSIVSQMVASAVKGFHSNGMICCLKHFPGHGDTTEDTHKQSVNVYKTWEQLKGCEMLPFAGGINAGADMVMTAHINLPNITSDGLPASLSYEIVTGRLRGEMGFSGVVVTDSLEMEAVRQQYGDANGAVRAVKAGVDIVLMPNDLGTAYNAVLNAVKSGEISQERLNESVRRILNLKRKYGII